MIRITNADQVLQLLRNHIERMQRERKNSRTEGKEVQRGPLARVRQMTSVDSLSHTEATRALISGLLAEEFGSSVAADPKFQKMIDDVRQIIDRDETSRELMNKALLQLTKKDQHG